ncbi:hypothetical protein Tco_0553628 [Tanacetum coccineum]
MSKIDMGSALDADPGKALDASLVVIECSGTKSDKHDTSSSSRTYITHAVDADIRLVNDQVPFAEVDSKTTPDLTNMCHKGGEIDQDVEQYQAKSPLLKAEFLKTNDMVEKEVYNELSNRFLQLEKHCISLEISKQQKEESFQSNKPCKNQDALDVKEASNEAKVKNDIDVIETTNIELEHSVAKLLAANEQLHKENEHLKQTYKELYDSIKKTRVQNKDNSDSLIIKFTKKSVDTPHYLPKVREYMIAKPHHVIAPGSDRNSQEEPYGSNNMAHNHYLEEVRKKTQERNRNSKPSVMHATSLQNTTNQVNSRAKVQSPKTRINNKPVVPKSHTQKPGRQIAIGQRFSPKKFSVVHEKPNTSRSCLRWKPTGRIFKIAGLRWIPTGKMFTDNTTKVDSEPSNGSNDDITNSYECDQTLNVSAGLVPQSPSPTPNVPPTKNDWDSLFCPMFDEYFNPSPSVVQPVLVAGVQEPVVSTGTPSSTRIDQDTPSTSTSQTTQEEQSHVIPTSVEEDNHEPSSEESSSRIVIPTNVHSVNQPQEHIEKWTKDHPLDKIIGDPSRPVSTRLQLQTEALFCYYDALLSSSEHKSYKDALTESCWIDAMKSSMSLNIWRFGSLYLVQIK